MYGKTEKKLSFKGHVFFERFRPEKFFEALTYLKYNRPIEMKKILRGATNQEILSATMVG